MAKETRRYWKMREARELTVGRTGKGLYTAFYQGETWKIWRGTNGRWYGQSGSRPGKLIDAATLQVAKNDLRMGYFVNCASAGA